MSSTDHASSDAPHPSLTQYLDSADFSKKALTIVVVGASGHLARNMVIPAIFSLYCKRLLPKHFHLVGYARSEMDDSSFRGDKLESGLKGHESHEKHNMAQQHDQEGNDEKKNYHLAASLLSMVGLSLDGDSNSKDERVSESDRTLRKNFLRRCYYVQGKYDQPGDYAKLQQRLEQIEKQNEDDSNQSPQVDGVNRIYYLAIPPPQFTPALESISTLRGKNGWTRVIVEKPFGEDLESAKKLNQLVAQKFKEEEIYRIDHFMGKDTLLNILPLRFSNLLYSSVWNKDHIASIIVNVKESFGLEGRAGYFDTAGIVRDMIQNHLLSIVALLTLEEPESQQDTALHKAKTAVFKSMKPATDEDVVLGQYGASADGKKVGYAEDEGVKENTKTPTYCAMVVHIENERWSGVPILMQTGKGLNKTKSEVFVNFKPVKSNIYSSASPNKVQIVLAPKPSVVQHINTKSPGISDDVEPVALELDKQGEQHLKAVPTAYERLVFDVIRGHRHLFVDAEEVEAAWAVVDGMLKRAEGSGKQPVKYQLGAHGPTETDQLLKKYQFSTTVEQL